MSLKADEVFQAGLALDADQRTVVAHGLLESLHDEGNDSGEVESAWSAELRRRVDEIASGDVLLVRGEESQARVRRLLIDVGE